MQIVQDALKEQVTKSYKNKKINTSFLKHDLYDSRSISRTNSNLESITAQQRSRRPSGGHDTPNSFSFERSPVKTICL
jgi:hypothetical protein